jgi:hypothetical protein
VLAWVDQLARDLQVPDYPIEAGSLGGALHTLDEVEAGRAAYLLTGK